MSEALLSTYAALGRVQAGTLAHTLPSLSSKYRQVLSGYYGLAGWLAGWLAGAASMEDYVPFVDLEIFLSMAADLSQTGHLLPCGLRNFFLSMAEDLSQTGHLLPCGLRNIFVHGCRPVSQWPSVPVWT